MANYITPDALENITSFRDLDELFDNKFRLNEGPIAKASSVEGIFKRWLKEFNNPYVTSDDT